MRFIAKVLKDSLHEKFPDAGEDELLKVSLRRLAQPRLAVELGGQTQTWAWPQAFEWHLSVDAGSSWPLVVRL